MERESGIAYSKLTNTPIPYKERWGNKLYKTEYVRWHRQTVVGLKRRPTKNADGTLYRDTHPECNLPYHYKRSKNWRCEVCQLDMLEGYKCRHLNSRGHLLRQKYFESQNESTPTPIVTSTDGNAVSIDINQHIRDKFEKNQNNVSKMFRGILQNAVPC
jgi:hypothetical protein